MINGKSVENIQDAKRKEFIEKYVPEVYHKFLGCDENQNYAVNYENYLQFIHYVADESETERFRRTLHRTFNDIDETATDVGKWSNAKLYSMGLMSESLFYTGIYNLTRRLTALNSKARENGLMFLNYVVDFNNREDCQDLLYALDTIYPAMYGYISAEAEGLSSERLE